MREGVRHSAGQVQRTMAAAAVAEERSRGAGSGADMTVSHVTEAAMIMHAVNTARDMTRFNPPGMRE